MTHGDGKERTRFVVGETKTEAEAALSLFKRQIAIHGHSPEGLTLEEASRRYEDYLELNRSPSTQRRYGRVLRTLVVCFLPEFHPDVQLLRQIKPSHLESYKRKRLAGDMQR